MMCVHVLVCEYRHVCAMAWRWRSKDNLSGQSPVCLPACLRQGLPSVVHSVSFQSFVTEGLPSSRGSAGITNDADEVQHYRRGSKPGSSCSGSMSFSY